MRRKINCEICGEEVKCDDHGAKHVKKIIDSFDNPIYYCDKCVVDYNTVFGAIVHWHNPFVEHAEEFDEAVKEFVSSLKNE